MGNLITNVDPDTKLYRFVSLYDLYDILVNKKLRFSKLSTFEDKNEGIGHILQLQENELFRFNYIETEGINKGFDYVQSNHFLSCWSVETDKIAMWALYSQNQDSIRISTTAGKLLEALKELNEQYSWTNYLDKPKSRQHISWNYKLRAVEYVSFLEVRNKLRKKYYEFKKACSTKFLEDAKYYESKQGFIKDYEDSNKFRILKEDGIFLKDNSYVHESEVRAVLYCGVRNDVTHEDWLKDENPFHNLFDAAKKNELSDYIYGDIPANFVNDICFDPRMPSYKKEIISQMYQFKHPRFINFLCIWSIA